METQIENSMESPAPVALEPKVEISKPSKKGPVGLMIFLIICLIGGLTYYVLKDNGIDLLSKESKTPATDTQVEEEDKNDTVGAGNFKIAFSFPSEGTPAVRFCFSDTKDISEQYCFWKKSSSDSSDYSKDFDGTEGELPIGTYTVDYSVYSGDPQNQSDASVYQIFALRECAYYANGDEGNTAKVEKYCPGVLKEKAKYTVITSGYSFPDYLINDSGYGGDLMEFEIINGKTTDIGTLMLSPYLE